MNNDLISRAALFNDLSHVKTLEEAFAVIQRIPAVPTDKGFIPRESAIRTAINLYHKCDTGSLEDYRDMMIEALEVLPPPSQRVESVGMHWIPCSEIMPEKGVEVITYTELTNFIELQSIESHFGIDYWENRNGDFQELWTVTAWMPRPKPYKEETQ